MGSTAAAHRLPEPLLRDRQVLPASRIPNCAAVADALRSSSGTFPARRRYRWPTHQSGPSPALSFLNGVEPAPSDLFEPFATSQASFSFLPASTGGTSLIR